MKNGFDGVNLDGRERSDLDDFARIAQLESEVLALRANSAIQEQIIKEGGNPFLKDKLVRLILENTMLKSRNGEAMELLEVSAAYAKKWKICAVCADFQRNKCKRGFCRASSNCAGCRCWKWILADRYEALKAQSGAPGIGADGEEQK